MRYADNVQEMPFDVLSFVYSVTEQWGYGSVVDSVCDFYPDAIHYPGPHSNSVTIPLTWGEDPDIARKVLRDAVRTARGRAWEVSSKYHRMSVCVPMTTMHIGNRKRKHLVGKSTMVKFLCQLPSTFCNYHQVVEGRSSPFAELNPKLDGSEAPIVTDVETVVLLCGDETNFVELQSMAHSHFVDNSETQLERVLVTWRGKGIWLGKQPKGPDSSALVEHPYVIRMDPQEAVE